MKSGIELIAEQRALFSDSTVYGEKLDHAGYAANYAAGEQVFTQEQVYLELEEDFEALEDQYAYLALAPETLDASFDVDRETQLIRAGALIAAELDRMIANRKKANEPEQEPSLLKEMKEFLTQKQIPFIDEGTHIVVIGDTFNFGTNPELVMEFGYKFMEGDNFQFAFLEKEGSKFDDNVFWIKGEDQLFDAIADEAGEPGFTLRKITRIP